MNKKLSVVLSASIALNVLAFSSTTRVNAEDIENTLENQNAIEAVSAIDTENVKREENSESVIKPKEPIVAPIDIQTFPDVKEMIKTDLNISEVDLPVLISSSQTAITGKIAKGVGVALYKVSDEDVKNGKFSPSEETLLTDSKFSIDSEDGSFLLPFKDGDMKAGSHIGLCVSYPTKDGNNNTKTFILDTIYIGVNVQTIKVGDNVDVKSMLEGVPESATIEIISLPDTSSIGNKEAKVRISYLGIVRDFAIPVMVNTPQAETNRISGGDRFETNIASVKRSFSNTNAKNIVIASGNSFADPLAAGPLAMKLNAPIIFSDKGGLREDALDLIKKLGAQNIIIVGGKSSVPDNVEKQLASYQVKRIAGIDRYETSKKLVNEFGASKHIIFTDGDDFADALSATPLAKKLNSPVLLVKNSNNIPSNIASYSDAYIVGGKNSVSTVVENNLKNKLNPEKVYRIYGKDRAETSTQVASILKYNENILANGKSFPDALSSINLLSSGGKNLILVGKDSASSDAKKLIDGKTNYIIGGYNTVSKNILGF
ncbi:cell wall-binding repeat-containing protein [Peptostreptococcus faecalis]|uniref:cell wall-binding repeat-containing protein n=1 Tax=Peptostreptococcus faecalis TaxID=2045015 RepID=UPI000C7CA310|nr:cell wall-binding repeat-containing protein [Peptostreptococcus faecalis]